eukprot:11989858-Alexandrium_andersonii.AAC.1
MCAFVSPALLVRGLGGLPGGSIGPTFGRDAISPGRHVTRFLRGPFQLVRRLRFRRQRTQCTLKYIQVETVCDEVVSSGRSYG